MKNHRAEAGLWVEGFLEESKKRGNHCGAREKFEQKREKSCEHWKSLSRMGRHLLTNQNQLNLESSPC
jgi:hypothetical protein